MVFALLPLATLRGLPPWPMTLRLQRFGPALARLLAFCRVGERVVMVRVLRPPARGEPIPVRLPARTPLFQVSAKLYRVLDLDLKAAGIPKRDDRGYTLDVHALRKTFGPLLSKGGVKPRTAQTAMRHSTIDLTMNVYTDARLLDVHEAVEALPMLPLVRSTDADKATGTAGKLAPPADNKCISLTTADDSRFGRGRELVAASALPDNECGPLPTSDNGPSFYPHGERRNP